MASSSSFVSKFGGLSFDSLVDTDLESDLGKDAKTASSSRSSKKKKEEG